jgi:hypothetical protein
VDGHPEQLAQRGYAWFRGGLGDTAEAYEVAHTLVHARCAADGQPPLGLIGDFVLPPRRGERSRDFQTLHFDFGLPLAPKVPQDVGRYTALFIPSGVLPVSAVTRLVPLSRLLAQRSWPTRAELAARLIRYGRTHGAFNDDQGYIEGSLARIVEAAAGAPALPSMKVDPDFLCGMEFDSLEAERGFFERHSLRLDEVQIDVPLSAGELLVFDNLALAHGRRGSRRPGELRQWVFGERSVAVGRQRELRDYVLSAFRARPS